MGEQESRQQDIACNEIRKQLPMQSILRYQRSKVLEVPEGRTFIGIQAQKKGLQISELLEVEGVGPWNLF